MAASASIAVATSGEARVWSFWRPEAVTETSRASTKRRRCAVAADGRSLAAAAKSLAV